MIGWYVHHHGSGHLRRMQSITSVLDEPVTVLSSLPPPPGEHREWLQLHRDDTGGVTAEHDVTAGGTLHWVPRHHDGLLARHVQLASWLERARPDLVVVDVSVEVALLVRLCGIPVVVTALPGDRSDPPHALAFDAADALLAAWPAGLPTGWPERWRRKAVFTGAISRFDDRIDDPVSPREPGTVLALWGTGGDGRVAGRLDRVERLTPGWRWQRVVPGAGRSAAADEVWDALRTAAVVVTHGGQNAVAETAAARAPAVVLAEPRPFDEQHQTVRRLACLDAAVALDGWPPDDQWPDLLARAEALGGERWVDWNDGRGARRAAGALTRLVRGEQPWREVS